MAKDISSVSIAITNVEGGIVAVSSEKDVMFELWSDLEWDKIKRDVERADKIWLKIKTIQHYK